ncbi:hypothetical protein [Aureibacter tunicatorum]|uniref:Deoxycytidine triphosphate deaminase n=1 Tax=Aureibacter tunicatorum TaxID=866807 RepID=A0AAE4BTW7_9BACT|nr:hypothetical protein [Aureibacter tunicatorum]MDR6241166.1 deoxycytidine triphosphate deaminase [Aureibacter tunicatorum]BDD03941.1 hypothetical protein AUTU_14240 [Aureibacter tunicatorum]
MKTILCLIVLILANSCTNTSKKIDIKTGNIEKIEIYKGSSGTSIDMKNDAKENFVTDLQKFKKIGPVKFGKTHSILIYHSNGKIDTIRTNGNTHQFNGWYKTEDNNVYHD